MARLCLLHTSDFHGQLTLEKAEHLRELKQARGALLFDCGDSLRAANVGLGLLEEPIVGLMNGLDYTAKTLGNREFHLWEAGLARKAGRFSMPLVCANLKLPPSSKAGLRPFLLIEHQGLRLGITGLMVPMVKPGAFWQGATKASFLDPITAGMDAAIELREQADLLIALTHIGIAEDKRLAEVADFDLILGGHSHSLSEQPLEYGNSYIVHSGDHAKTVGALTLEGAPGDWRITDWEVISL
jgi:2',3'-cyclic-nucleotide 2'-phosphodiesterase (5'-nucleotidase family)